MPEEYFFAPCHVLQNITVPPFLVAMCGGPEAFIKMQRELRDTPMNELPADVVDAIQGEIKRLENERK